MEQELLFTAPRLSTSTRNWNWAQIRPDQVHWGFKRTRPKSGKVRNFRWSARPNFMWKSLFTFWTIACRFLDLCCLSLFSHFCGALYEPFQLNVSYQASRIICNIVWLFFCSFQGCIVLYFRGRKLNRLVLFTPIYITEALFEIFWLRHQMIVLASTP